MPRALAALLLPLLCSVTPVRSQDPCAADPYVGGDAALLFESGILSLGPLPWADEHWTQNIDAELGRHLHLRWAETRHFKIGIGLADRKWPTEKKEKADLQDEIAELGKVLPALRKRPSKIDSWLLLHLYARRLEALYADFCERMHIEDLAPPLDKDQREPHDGRGFAARGGLGKGPFLGQHGKYLVLILEQRSDVGRYLRRFAGRDISEPVAHQFLGSNSLLYITTPDIKTKGLSTERALHCNVVYGVIRNLVDGVNGYTYDIPVWVKEGLGHWYQRRLDENYNSFCGLDERQFDLLVDADWPKKTRARVETGAFAPAAELLLWQPADCTDFHKHVMMWARADFLLGLGDGVFGKFLLQLKALPTTGASRQAVLEQQQRALADACGMDPAQFDARWVDWVKATYKRR